MFYQEMALKSEFYIVYSIPFATNGLKNKINFSKSQKAKRTSDNIKTIICWKYCCVYHFAGNYCYYWVAWPIEAPTGLGSPEKHGSEE